MASYRVNFNFYAIYCIILIAKLNVVILPAQASSYFSLLQNVQTVCGAHPAFLFSGREADHSPPFSAKVKMSGAIPPFPHVLSWRAH
jgi:hypothetical protein